MLLVIVRGVRQGDAPVTSVEVTNEAVNLEKLRSGQATSTAALVGERHTYEQVVVVVVAIQEEEDANLEAVRNPPVVSIRVVAEVEAGFQDTDSTQVVGEHEYHGASAEAAVVVCILVVVLLPPWP